MLTDKENQQENSSYSYSVCELTLGFFFIHVHTLTNQNAIEAIICHLQHEAAVYHTVPGFEPSVDDITIVQVLHPLTNQFTKCILMQITPVIQARPGAFASLTRIRSINRDDLNIQSSRTFSLLSRSSRLPLLQCSVTTPKMPESKNSPSNKLMFSCLISLS